MTSGRVQAEAPLTGGTSAYPVPGLPGSIGWVIILRGLWHRQPSQFQRPPWSALELIKAAREGPSQRVAIDSTHPERLPTEMVESPCKRLIDLAGLAGVLEVLAHRDPLIIIDCIPGLLGQLFNGAVPASELAIRPREEEVEIVRLVLRA